MILRKKILTSIFLVSTILGGCQFIDSFQSGHKYSSPEVETPSTDSPSQNNNFTDNSSSDLEKSIHKLVNEYRRDHNLPALELDSRISQQARIHSENMALGKVPFSHNGFQERAKAVEKDISYRKFAENVAYNQGYDNPPESAVEGWINSPGHRKNMEGDFDLTGIGVAKNSKGEYYFTQLFVLKSPKAKNIPIHDLEMEVHKLVNQYRRSRNLSALKIDPRISQQARIHSENMASGKVPFSHNGFQERGKAIEKSISYRKFAENVAYNKGYTNPAEFAVKGWIKSTGHRQNMEGDFNLTGIGIAKNSKQEYYFTQLFVLQR